jgi:hypothetical protein
MVVELKGERGFVTRSIDLLLNLELAKPSLRNSYSSHVLSLDTFDLSVSQSYWIWIEATRLLF